MIILHPYSQKRLEDQKGLLELLETFRPLSFVEEIIHAPTDAPDAYERAIVDVWGRDDLMIVEQDIFPTPYMICQMFVCDNPVCVQAYKLYSKSIGEEQYAHRYMNYDTPYSWKWEWVQPGKQWADMVGLGMIRIRKEVQETVGEHIKELIQGNYINIDVRLSELLVKYAPVGFHVHWPEVEHRHK